MLRRGPATLDELVNELGLTRTAVRLQLAVLERDGSVERRGMRRGRTKPAHVYELTGQAEQRLSRAYIPVLTQLLHVLADRLSSAEFDAVMRDVGRELLAGQPRPRGARKARAEAASDLLNELGGLTDVSEEDHRSHHPESRLPARGRGRPSSGDVQRHGKSGERVRRRHRQAALRADEPSSLPLFDCRRRR